MTSHNYVDPKASGLEGHGLVSAAQADLPFGMKFQYSKDAGTT